MSISAEVLLRDLAEELYYRAQAARGAEERKAIKGIQHCIERVLVRHGYETFRRESQNGHMNV